MTPLEKELETHHQQFLADWTKQAQKNWGTLSKDASFVASYRRLSCLNAIQHTLILPKLSVASAAFFLEAQNDALVSHVNANVGSWRTSLQALRSLIENVLGALYFYQHAVELDLWAMGKFRTTFSDLHKYFSMHPKLASIDANVSGLAGLKSEYATLSKAVHASAANFRMTDGASKILLWSTAASSLGSWSTREKKVVEALASLLICFFNEELQGTRHSQLRAILTFAVGSSRQKQLKSAVKVNISV